MSPLPLFFIVPDDIAQHRDLRNVSGIPDDATQEELSRLLSHARDVFVEKVKPALDAAEIEATLNGKRCAVWKRYVLNCLENTKSLVENNQCNITDLQQFSDHTILVAVVVAFYEEEYSALADICRLREHRIEKKEEFETAQLLIREVERYEEQEEQRRMERKRRFE